MDKVISFFWGNESMSWLRYMTLKTFSILNPDWKINLYLSEQKRSTKYWLCENKQDFFAYRGPDYLDLTAGIPNIQIRTWSLREPDLGDMGPSHESNFFKWQLLAILGGVYADMDIVFVKPIDEWFDLVKDADTGICYQETAGMPQFSIGLMSSKGINQFFADIYYKAVESFNPDIYQCAGVMPIYLLLGHYANVGTHWNELCRKYPAFKHQNFSMEYVYPFDCTMIPEIFERTHTELPSKTFGIHWYAGSDLAQQQNNYLSPWNITTAPGTLAYYLRSLL